MAKSEFVTNNVVKQEWKSKFWIESKTNHYFYFAGQIYNSTKYGEIMVGFNKSCAFVLTFSEIGLEGVQDVSDLFTFENYKAELKGLTTEQKFYEFPTVFGDNCILLSEPDTDEIYPDTIKALGLEEFTEDIQARLYDVLQYNPEWEDDEE